MYQVVELYGNFEPWWFLEDWKEDIIGVQTFDTFEEALGVYKNKWWRLRVSHPFYRSHESLLSAFWDLEDQSWCDDCDESLQEYRSLALLYNWEELDEQYHLKEFEQRNDRPQGLTACKLKKIG